MATAICQMREVGSVFARTKIAPAVRTMESGWLFKADGIKNIMQAEREKDATDRRRQRPQPPKARSHRQAQTQGAKEKGEVSG